MTQKKPGLFRRFFRFLGAILRGLRALVSLLIVLSVVFWIWIVSKAFTPITVPEGAILLWNPAGKVVERKTIDPLTEAVGQWLGDPVFQSRMRDLTDSLAFAANDERISALLVDLDSMGYAGPGQIEELQRALETFSTAEKPMFVRATWLDQSRYALAAPAGEIWLDPYGAVAIEGYSVYRNYFRDALDKLDADVNVFRVGEFKSAVEPFLRNDMSPEAREANANWLTSLWSDYKEGLARNRNVAEEQIDDYASFPQKHLREADGHAARAAQQLGLADSLGTGDELDMLLDERFGINGDSYQTVEFSAYAHAQRLTEKALNVDALDAKVAVITAQGEITLGSNDPEVADADLIVPAIQAAMEDDDVKAMVLRVDTPGGGVFASELIRRAVVAFRDTGRPVVVSMGTVAASGGYWISANADTIVADSSTITGSIGVFGLIPTFQRSLENLGIHGDGVGTTPMAGALRFDRELSPELRDVIQQSVEFSYREFIHLVAEGRSLPEEQVKKIAGGRVWSGAQAMQLGLVDVLGGTDVALEQAAALAGLNEGEWRSEYRESAGSPMGQLAGGAASITREFFAADLPAPLQNLSSKLDSTNGWMSDPRAQYAWCPCGHSELGSK